MCFERADKHFFDHRNLQLTIKMNHLPTIDENNPYIFTGWKSTLPIGNSNKPASSSVLLITQIEIT